MHEGVGGHRQRRNWVPGGETGVPDGQVPLSDQPTKPGPPVSPGRRQVDFQS